MIITFTNNGEPGLGRTTEARQIKITYKTVIDPVWLAEAKTNAGKSDHLNTVWLEHNSWVSDDAIAHISPLEVDKSGAPSGTRIVDGVELPVYKYEIMLIGVDSDSITITDEFDTSILAPYNGGDDAFCVYGGNAKDNLFSRLWNAPPVQYTETTDGVVFNITSANIPKNGGSYWTYYKFVYYLTVKDAEALNTLGIRAVTDGGVTQLINKATWEGETDTTSVTYAYNGLDKELLTPDEELITDGGDIYADFRITLNPAAQKLNGGSPLTMTDTVSNLSVDITSIQANPSAGVTWDMSGNTVTYTIPDETKVVITYRARVLFTGSGALKVSFSNHAEMDAYHDDVDGTAERHSSGGGSGSVPRINLMKYEAGNMTKRLAGAKFQLLNANKQPVKGTKVGGVPCDPYDIIFITDENGMITVEGSQGDDGWAIMEDTRYYLREIEAPPGYMLSTFDYSFQVSSDGTTDYSRYIYHSGDTMTAKNYPGTDVQVEKVWADGNGNHESDTVTVKLQQKIDGGDWSDTIREEVKQGNNYVWVDNTAGRTLTLDKNSNWAGKFAELPLEVPNLLPASTESVDVAVEYRVI
jgi:hypothetical protein